MRAPIAGLALRHSGLSSPINLFVAGVTHRRFHASWPVAFRKATRPDTDRVPQSMRKRRTPP